MQMNYKVAGQFEHLYPVTLGDNVRLNSGKTLEEWKVEIDDLLNAVEDGTQTIIWEGTPTILGVTGAGFDVGQNLSDAPNGWILVWNPSGSGSNTNYCYIPKLHPGGYGIKLIIGGAGGTVYSKFIIINGSTINGHSTNNASGNETMVLTKIIKY